MSPGLRELTTRCAPKPRASSALELRRGKGRDLAAPRFGELQCKMAKAADADHAHAVGRPDVKNLQGRKDRHAAAEQRSSVGWIEPLRDRHGPGPLRPHAVGEAAVVSHNRGHILRAQVSVAAETLITVHAAARAPAEADALADLEALGVRTQRNDLADDLMPGDDGVARDAPFVVEHRHVGVTKPARLNRDLDVVSGQRARVIAVRLERLVRAFRGPGIDRHHSTTHRCEPTRGAERPVVLFNTMR